MKGDLKVGMFTELTETEAEMADGGSILSGVLDIVHGAIVLLATPAPSFIETPVMWITELVVKTIDNIATPVYKMAGLKFRG